MTLWTVVQETHLVLAFLAALCAVIFSWTPNGRRVVNAVVVLQFLVGLVVAGVMGSTHQPIPPLIWLHLLIALAVLACYGMAIRYGKRAGGARPALLLSIIGLVLIFVNIWLGWTSAHGAGTV
jgi:FtsH-binding integral membrane protein